MIVEVVVRFDLDEADTFEEAADIARECVSSAMEEWNTAGTYDDVEIVSIRAFVQE